MAILISNDDGIESAGILALVDAVHDLDDTYVVAPDQERSTCSHGITLHQPLKIDSLGNRRFAITGTPSDCVLLAVREILPVKPCLVISGINHGANLGDDVTYSGTVSAALEGALLGIPAFAISLVSRGDFDFKLAARFARILAQKLLASGLPDGVYLNVNIPGNLVGAIGSEMMLPVTVTRTGKRDGRKITQEKTNSPTYRHCQISADHREFKRISGTDCEAVLNRQISVTPLLVDITHYGFFDELKTWNFEIS